MTRHLLYYSYCNGFIPDDFSYYGLQRVANPDDSYGTVFSLTRTEKAETYYNENGGTATAKPIEI